MKILFTTSEIYPLIKTGGLADVSASLAGALHALGQEVRLLLPAYPSTLSAANELRTVTTLQPFNRSVLIHEGKLPGTALPLYLVDAPGYFDRPGDPYSAEDGSPWPDNAERFALFCRVAVDIAMDRAGLSWQPDIVHCHDWPSGLIPALLALESRRPAAVFTIHNLAYQGLFPRSTFKKLALPAQFWRPDSLEFHGQLSFIKGGLVYADRLNTVSPNYAEEIQTPEFGYGLEGLLSHRKEQLSGILNGIDTDWWNPKEDRFIPQPYDSRSLDKKKFNKAALQDRFQLPQHLDIPLIVLISRLVAQKGIDLVLKAMPRLLELPAQWIFLGQGEADYEHSLIYWARRHPVQMAVKIGYDEALAHHLEAGADLFLMPSCFEPCGLNQMYSQRYGTVPIVRGIGGLVDTVQDASPDTLARGDASGIVFEDASGGALLEAVKRALLLFSFKQAWRKVQLTGMQKDFSWQKSAQQYIRLYEKALADRIHPARFQGKGWAEP